METAKENGLNPAFHTRAWTQVNTVHLSDWQSHIIIAGRKVHRMDRFTEIEKRPGTACLNAYRIKGIMKKELTAMWKTAIACSIFISLLLFATSSPVFAENNPDRASECSTLSGSLLCHHIIDPDEFTYTQIINDGGQIYPNGKISVRKGTSATFTITPLKGYMVETIIIDDRSIPINSLVPVKRTIVGDGREHVIKVRFKKVY